MKEQAPIKNIGLKFNITCLKLQPKSTTKNLIFYFKMHFI